MSKQLRARTLLLKAAEAFDDGRDPFSEAFLTDNEVTSDECFKLSEQLGTLVRGFLAYSEDEQMEIVAVGVPHKISPEMIPAFRTQMQKRRTLNALKKL